MQSQNPDSGSCQGSCDFISNETAQKTEMREKIEVKESWDSVDPQNTETMIWPTGLEKNNNRNQLIDKAHLTID